MKPMKASPFFTRFITMLITWMIPLLVLISPAAGLAAERAKAIVTCQPAEAKLEYECMIMLSGRKSGKPITGAKILVNADMPSMAMVHNVRPVHAVPMSKPGLYKMRIKLEMMGEWALRLKISGPTRDLVIVKTKFGTPHTMPAAHRNKMDNNAGSAGMKQKNGMKHGNGMIMKTGMKHKK